MRYGASNNVDITRNDHSCHSTLPSFRSPRRQRSAHRCRHCEYSAQNSQALDDHIRQSHRELPQCQECGQMFPVTDHVNQHALHTKHRAFKCLEEGCQATFTRNDVLRRHRQNHEIDTRQHSCQFCPATAFARKDHLTQHMRNWHRIDGRRSTATSGRSCPHPFCPQYRTSESSMLPMPFKESKDYIHHVRHEHNESPFPCLEAGCDKIDGKGYFREVDLVKHRKKSHLVGQGD
jgi:hypothetical protein